MVDNVLRDGVSPVELQSCRNSPKGGDNLQERLGGGGNCLQPRVRVQERHCEAASLHRPSLSTASLERVRIAAIRVSRGSLPGLLQAIDLGQTDFRDLLMAAGFGRDVEAHLYWWPRADE